MMSVLTHKTSQSLSSFLTLIDHHRFTTVLVVIAAAWMIYMLSIPGSYQTRSTSPAVPVDPRYEELLDHEKAFTYLAGWPALPSHEYTARTDFIHAQLEMLRDDIHADSVYIFSYHPSSDEHAFSGEQQVSATFEVTRRGVAPNLYLLQDITVYAWEYVKDIQTGVALGSSLYGNGTELHDSTGTPIGYMGIFYLDGRYAFSEIEASRLEDVGQRVEIALSYPSETFHQLLEE